jgi:nitroimidazol reductase NimA-like FMN-containing flavoprotein (pyridoxamine 5'-phosphate oxidase superfamily)
MPEKILDFLKTKEVCTLAVQMLDGSPHAATVHFAYQPEPLTFVIFTNPKYRKAEPILKKDTVLASMVITNDYYSL